MKFSQQVSTNYVLTQSMLYQHCTRAIWNGSIAFPAFQWGRILPTYFNVNPSTTNDMNIVMIVSKDFRQIRYLGKFY